MVQVFSSISDERLIPLLKAGSVGVLPTDTVYGLVCRADNQKAVERLYGLKKRENKPGTIIAANTEQLVELGIKACYLKAVKQFWPGAVSVVVPTSLDYLHSGANSLPVRIPNQADLVRLLKQVGPLVTTSANKPNKKPAATLAEAQAIFGDSVDFYVDGGDLSDRKPSTIIRIIDDQVEVLRKGTVKL